MTSREFREQIQRFILYLSAEKNSSAHTVRAYQADLTQFVDFWDHCSADAPELPFSLIVDRFFVVLYNEQRDKGTIARKISCLRSFARFVAAAGFDIKVSIARPRIDKKLPVYLSEQEITTLFDDLTFEKVQTKNPYRDMAILELLYATGIRCSELVRITFDAIDFENKQIRISGKGKKERMVLFGSKAKERIEQYITHERVERKRFDEVLFLNSRYQPLTTRSIQRICERFRIQLHIKKPITPHKLRHSFATHLVNQNTDLRIVQELLGHAQLSTTEKYTHVASAQLEKIYETLHPFNHMIKKTDT